MRPLSIVTLDQWQKVKFDRTRWIKFDHAWWIKIDHAWWIKFDHAWWIQFDHAWWIKFDQTIARNRRTEQHVSNVLVCRIIHLFNFDVSGQHSMLAQEFVHEQ
jgi:hypothetical protein